MAKRTEPKQGFRAPMTDRRACEIVENAWKNYEGDCTVFMSAAGALMFGRAVGWKGVRVVMSAVTYRKYEKILGVRFRDVLPDRLPDSTAINGIHVADEIGKFWQALSAGMIPALEGKMTRI
jgi:hypothetical protein